MAVLLEEPVAEVVPVLVPVVVPVEVVVVVVVVVGVGDGGGVIGVGSGGGVGAAVSVWAAVADFFFFGLSSSSSSLLPQPDVNKPSITPSATTERYLLMARMLTRSARTCQEDASSVTRAAKGASGSGTLVGSLPGATVGVCHSVHGKPGVR